MTVKDALYQRRWVRHITGARTAPVLYEYVLLWDKLESVQLRPLVGDRFIWRWTPDGTYSASSAYRSFFLGMSSLLGAKNYGKLQPRRRSNSFSGWLCMTVFGRQIAGGGTAYRSPLRARFAARMMKRLIISW